MKEPLTPEEVQAASDLFFPLFDIVNSQMPEDATITDTLDVMESICKLAHQSREMQACTIRTARRLHLED